MSLCHLSIYREAELLQKIIGLRTDYENWKYHTKMAIGRQRIKEQIGRHTIGYAIAYNVPLLLK